MGNPKNAWLAGIRCIIKVNIIARKNAQQNSDQRIEMISRHFYRSGSYENIKSLEIRCQC